MNINKLAKQSLKPMPILDAMQTKMAELEENAGRGWRDIQPYYRFLYYLVEERTPFTAIELGLWNGLGSAYMCAANHNTIVMGVDINRPKISPAFQYDNFKFINTDTKNMEQKIGIFVKLHGPIGLVFQDSSHHYKASCNEWDILQPYLEKNAIWMCDDITPSFFRPGLDEKSMLEYFDERPGKKKYKFNDLHIGSTIGVIEL